MAEPGLLGVKIVGLRSLRGRFAEMADVGLLEIQMEKAEEARDELEELYRKSARESFKAASGTFESGLQAHVEPTGDGFAMSVTTDDPILAERIRKGTGIYAGGGRIEPVNGPVLVFDWPGGPPELAGPDGKFRFASIAGMPSNPWEETAEESARALLPVLGNRIGVRVVDDLGKPFGPE